MKKKLLTGLILMSLLLATVTTAFANGGEEPKLPSAPPGITTQFNSCMEWEGNFDIKGPAIHDGYVKLQNGDLYEFYVWISYHPSPMIINLGSPIKVVVWWWHPEAGGGREGGPVHDFAPSCATNDCLQVSRWYETRTGVDGVDYYVVHYLFRGLCTASVNNNKETGYTYSAPGGLWYNGVKDYEWRSGDKYTMALLPNSCGPWRVELRGQGGVGGALNWNPPGCK